MRKALVLFVFGFSLAASNLASANLLTNGHLDITYQQEILPGFFLPKPANWVNEGFRTITGPYEEEMSSEPWAGPAPTPVTNFGVGGTDWGVFFKPFTGNSVNGPATGHLYQDVPGTPGLTYSLSGWAGAEANILMDDAVMALEFLDGVGTVISYASIHFLPSLFIPNGQPFNYKEYSLGMTAPAGTVSVRSRVSMINGIVNPQGGGQAYVVDDFELLVVPEPGTLVVLGAGALLLALRRRRSS